MGQGLKAVQMAAVDPMTACGRKGKEFATEWSMGTVVPSTKPKAAVDASSMEMQSLFGGKKPA